MTKKLRETLVACLFLSPNIIGFLVFTLVPVISAFLLSLYAWDLCTAPKFVGLKNFAFLLGDKYFWQALWNTIYFTTLSVPLGIFTSLFFAILLNQEIKGRVIFRSIYFLPVISSMIAVALIWRWLYNTDVGLINSVLVLMGNGFISILNGIGKLFGASPISPILRGPDWLGSPRLAIPAVVIMSVWKSLGYNMLIYLAGLQGIPGHLYEAAEIDGANRWEQFLHVTWPSLAATTFFVMIMSLIGSFQVFGEVYIMTQGGPGGATTTLVYLIYKHAFKFCDMGYATAIATVLFAMILSVTLIQWKFFKQDV